jgi:hypothetical protein
MKKRERRGGAGNFKKKSVFFAALAGVLAVLVGVSAFFLFFASKKIPGAAGTVNGEPFFQEDLDVYALELRAAVAANYGRRYNLHGVGAKFWDTPYDGTTPRETLYKLALEKLVRNMVLIQEARKRGINTPESYHDLEAERQAWNAPSEEIVYGPEKLGPAEFTSYRLAGITGDLKRALLEKELAPGEAQLRVAYDSLPVELKYAPWKASGTVFKWDGPSPEKELRAALARGLNPEAAVRELAGAFPGLTGEDFTINSSYISKEDPYEQELAQALNAAAPGSLVSAPLEKPELYHVAKKEGGGILRFEEAPGLGQNKWINDQFEIFLNKKTKAARVRYYPAPAR